MSNIFEFDSQRMQPLSKQRISQTLSIAVPAETVMWCNMAKLFYRLRGATPNCRTSWDAIAGTRLAPQSAELNRALKFAETKNLGVYIEVVTAAYAASSLALQLHGNMKTRYP